ncbi:hypothetical protein DPMN_085337 [Dreissena polymorpha]|uniref:Receptor ligand binding region domain-containing protein n=1 Tax=Dreissena polymorpha TaxID=45954 RepID=A0A9D3YDH7_DREPO|nr:hypothetical protein DPMN_085337 [Dreissena polymorpha]
MLLAIFLAHVAGCYALDGKPKELRLLGMLPMTGTTWPGGSSCLVPVQMALEDVNAYPGLLYGYNLTYEYIDSMVGQLTYVMFLFLFVC